MGQKILLTRDAGSPQLSELRALTNGIEQRVLLHRWIRTVFSFYSLAQLPKRRVRLSAKAQGLGVPVQLFSISRVPGVGFDFSSGLAYLSFRPMIQINPDQVGKPVPGLRYRVGLCQSSRGVSRAQRNHHS